MSSLKQLEPAAVFSYFEEISAIPRGSGHMKEISDYCVSFAKTRGLSYVQDRAFNVVIYKPGTEGYEQAEPIILQGHLDMVWQKNDTTSIDFLKEGLKLSVNGEYIQAEGTTLGADDGIAVSMCLAILDSRTIPHPPLEVVFTTDEEVGMKGALSFDTALLSGHKMINIDSEDPATVTVSCAGGEDLFMRLSCSREEATGQRMVIDIQGLTGGHSGVEIHKNRVNGICLLGRILKELAKKTAYAFIDLSGGDKANAIPPYSRGELLVADRDAFMDAFYKVSGAVKKELAQREPSLTITVKEGERGTFSVYTKESAQKSLSLLEKVPYGVLAMSREIENLVETSVNPGILTGEPFGLLLHCSLRSNKLSSLKALEKELQDLGVSLGATCHTEGAYPPWEYNSRSVLVKQYEKAYEKRMGERPQILAIHAGLECGVFARNIPNFDCISIGPEILDIHTVREKLNIHSVKEIFNLVCDILQESI